MEQPGGRTPKSPSLLARLAGHWVIVTVAVVVVVGGLSDALVRILHLKNEDAISFGATILAAIIATVALAGFASVLRRNARARLDEAQARQRVRQAEDQVANALRGPSTVFLPVDTESAQLSTPSEDHAQLDADRMTRDAAPAGTGTKVDLNRIAERFRLAQHEQRESDQRIFVRPDGTLDLDSVVDRVVEVTADTFYGSGNPKMGVGESGDRSNDRLALAALWDVTHGRLDLYHQIVTGQARRSFGAAQVAIVIGFVLLVVFAVLAVRAKTTTGAISVGSLGAIGAAFAAYIGRTFIRSQETAASHLRAYFDQPLELSRYLAAERLLADAKDLTPEQRAAIVSSLVQAIATAGSGTGKPGETKPRSRGRQARSRPE
jgi:hypothetical protein